MDPIPLANMALAILLLQLLCEEFGQTKLLTHQLMLKVLELTGLNFAAVTCLISSSTRMPASTSSKSSFLEIFHSCSL